MGIFSGMKLSTSVAGGTVLPFPRKVDGIASPWSDSSGLLPALVAADFLGFPNALPINRLEALKVPAVAKGRAVLHSLIGTRPLVSLTAAGVMPATDQPTWLYRSDTPVSPQQRTCQMLDDILFNEASLLAVKRGAAGQIIDAAVVPYDDWSLDENNDVLYRGAHVDEASVVYIPGPGPGLLVQARETIIAARAIDKAWQARVRNPAPTMILEEKEDNGMTSAEATPYVEAVATARRNPDSAVMWVPYKMNLRVETSEATDLFETGRNALRLDFANFMNMPTALLDGSVAEASLTYSTQEGRRNELFDYTIPYWAGPIEQALSLDNVVPRGQRVRFDFADLLNTAQSPTGPTEQD